ncbi:MAG TPA: hypothetical protein VMT16_17145 [Thermoanaerobaculia bacterium]|nr:hypothetical protein [Thermoanaerobaculia bacterium]
MVVIAPRRDGLRCRLTAATLVVPLLAVGFAAGLPTPVHGEGEPVGQSGGVWNLGQVPVGKRYPTTASATNLNCRGAHDFELSFEGAAKGLLLFAAENVVRGVKKGETKSVPVFLDARNATPGVYDTGYLVSKCLSCPLSCHLDYQRIDIRLTLVAPAAGGESGAAIDRPDGGGAMSAPPEEKGPARRCGPEVRDQLVKTLERAASRIAKLPGKERTAAGAKDFLRRNPIVLLPEDPAGGSACPLSAPCLKSVTLFGACVPHLTPEAVLRGFVETLLGLRSYSELKFEDELHSTAETAAATGRAMGNDWARYYKGGSFSNPGGSYDGEDAPAVLPQSMKYWTAGGLGLMLQGRYASCPPCDAQAGFASDWTQEAWRLSDGSDAAPPKE